MFYLSYLLSNFLHVLLSDNCGVNTWDALCCRVSSEITAQLISFYKNVFYPCFIFNCYSSIGVFYDDNEKGTNYFYQFNPRCVQQIPDNELQWEIFSIFSSDKLWLIQMEIVVFSATKYIITYAEQLSI